MPRRRVQPGRSEKRRSDRKARVKTGRTGAGKKGVGGSGMLRLRLASGLIGGTVRFVRTPLGTTLFGLFLIASAIGAVVYNHFYWKYHGIIERRMEGGAFDQTARFLAVPRLISKGDPTSVPAIVRNLRAAGYTRSEDNPVGWYALAGGAIEIHPGQLSHFDPLAARIEVEEGRVSRIVAPELGRELNAYKLEPELITNQFDQERSKRRLFKFQDYPQHLIDAVIAIEDHRFYRHGGIDFLRTAGAAIEGLSTWERPRGTSTLSQQLARNFFLTREVTLRRKMAEAMIAVQLESRLTKEEIFENYANQIFMGYQSSFNIHGFGEAARAFFDKDVRDVTLAEAALLAGLPQGPSYLNPYRYPERAKQRRGQVLTAMLREGYVDEQSWTDASAEDIVLARGHMESRDAPYYIDLVNRSLSGRFEAKDLETKNFWVYTTLDKRLQEIAVEAVREGMELVDERVAAQRRYRGKEPPRPQVALVAMDPRSGEIKAVVGGRDYGGSQLNRALAKRQPGSVFKPFVFAAAFDTALDAERQTLIERGYGNSLPEYAMTEYPPPPGLMTPATLVIDEPTEFVFSEDQDPYAPSNHKDHYFGRISLRLALMKSINVATVKVGEMVGYQRVLDLASRAGMGADLLPVPSMCLGTFEVTPVEVAAAYSAFANGGVRVEPRFVDYVRDDQGRTLFESRKAERPVIDKRVAYLVTNIMQDVIRHGSGIRARVRYGITNAAGKTGTDDDGWFAGFSNDLICVVWVGFDDNTDLGLEGAHSALPIWAMFMQRVSELASYANPGAMPVPEGVVRVPVDPIQRTLAEEYCKECRQEAYIAGTQPDTSHMVSYLAAKEFHERRARDAPAPVSPLLVRRPVREAPGARASESQ